MIARAEAAQRACRVLALVEHRMLSRHARSLLASMRAEEPPHYKCVETISELEDARIVDVVNDGWEVTSWGHFVGCVGTEDA